MSKERNETPVCIRPYDCHGCDMEHATDNQWVGDCLFCGKEKHFYVNAETGTFNCKRCNESGNVVSFLTKLIMQVHAETPHSAFQSLASDLGTVFVSGKTRKKNVFISVLKAFKIGWTGNEWLIPVYSAKTKMVRDIRRYDLKQVMATWGCKTQLGNASHLIVARADKIVWLCEGEKDAIVLTWLIRLCKKKDIVTWVPGASIFKEAWAELFNNKNVIVAYDHDGAGERGRDLVYKRINNRVDAIRSIRWPVSVPNGFDVRDFIVSRLAGGATSAAVYAGLLKLTKKKVKCKTKKKNEMLGTGVEVDDDDDDVKPGIKVALLPELELKRNKQINPKSFDELVRIFQEVGIEMDEDTVLAFKLMLAVCLSNDMPVGDPLWLYIVGQSGRGKTLLLNALDGSTRTVFRSNVTPHSLISGWNEKGGADPSLLPLLSGKTFVIKDFTEVITMPIVQQDEVFSTLRGAYDGVVDRSFGNGIKRNYNAKSKPPFYGFSILAGVTDAIHGHKKASLGERFMKFQMKPASKEQEFITIERAISNVGRETVIQTTMQIATGKFLTRVLESNRPAKVSSTIVKRLKALVQLIAVLRAQVERDWRTDDVTFRPVPELGTRLAKQLVKLGMLIAVVMDKTEIDDEVYDDMERVAFNTAHGFHLEIIQAIMRMGGRATRLHVAKTLGLPSSTMSRRFDDLILLKVLEPSERTVGFRGGKPSQLYAVTDKIAELWRHTQKKGSELCAPIKVRKPRTHSRLKPVINKEQSRNFTEESRAPKRLSWN